MVETAEAAGDGGLTRTGIAGEDGVEHHIATGVEAPTASLLEETGLMGHGHDALLHGLETDHLIELAHGLVEGGGAAGELLEGHILFLHLGRGELEHRVHGALEEAGADLLDHEAMDIGEGPAREDALLEAVEHGAREAVFHDDIGEHVLAGDVVIEGLHQLEGGVRLLLHVAIGEEKLAERGVDVQQLVDLLACATEPEGQGAVGIANLLDDASHHHLAVRARKLLQIGEAEHLDFGIGHELVKGLVRIVERQIEERGSIDHLRLEVDGHEALETLQGVLVNIVIAGADEQILRGVELEVLVLLEQLIVHHESAYLHGAHSELGHTRHVGDALPIVVAILKAIGEHLLDASRLTKTGLAHGGMQLLIEAKLDLDGSNALGVVDEQDVSAWHPDLIAPHGDGDGTAVITFLTSIFVGTTHGVIGVVIDKTAEAVVAEVGLAARMEGYQNGGIPETIHAVELIHLEGDACDIGEEVVFTTIGVQLGIGHAGVHLLGERK